MMGSAEPRLRKIKLGLDIVFRSHRKIESCFCNKWQSSTPHNKTMTVVGVTFKPYQVMLLLWRGRASQILRNFSQLFAKKHDFIIL